MREYQGEQRKEKNRTVQISRNLVRRKNQAAQAAAPAMDRRKNVIGVFLLIMVSSLLLLLYVVRGYVDILPGCDLYALGSNDTGEQRKGISYRGMKVYKGNNKRTYNTIRGRGEIVDKVVECGRYELIRLTRRNNDLVSQRR